MADSRTKPRGHRHRSRGHEYYHDDDYQHANQEEHGSYDSDQGQQSYSGQGTVMSDSQPGTTTYPEQPYSQASATHLQEEATSQLGAWAPGNAFDVYPPSLPEEHLEEPHRNDQEQTGHNRGYRGRRQGQQQTAYNPSRYPADHGSQSYDAGRTSYPSRPRGYSDDNRQTTPSMRMMPTTQLPSTAMTTLPDYGHNQSSYDSSVPAADWGSNDPTASGITSRLGRLSFSSQDPSATTASPPTLPSSFGDSYGQGFSPIARPQWPSRRSSHMSDAHPELVLTGESAVTSQRRRSSTPGTTSGSHRGGDGSRDEFSPSSGARRSVTWDIAEADSPEESDDTHTSQLGSDADKKKRGKKRKSQRDDRRAQNASRTGEDDRNKKNKRSSTGRTTQYIDDQEKQNWRNRDRNDRRDRDGHGAYDNSRSY